LFPVAITADQIELLKNNKLECLMNEEICFGETQKQIGIVRYIALHPQLLKFILGSQLGFYNFTVEMALQINKVEAASLFFQIQEN